MRGVTFLQDDVYDRLERQMMKVTDPDLCAAHLDRLVKICTFSVEKRSPATENEWKLLGLLFKLAKKSKQNRTFLDDYLCDISRTMCSALVKGDIDTAKYHTYVIDSFVNLVRLGCEIEKIAELMSSLSLGEENGFELQLFLKASDALVQFAQKRSMSLKDRGTSKLFSRSPDIRCILGILEQFIRKFRSIINSDIQSPYEHLVNSINSCLEVTSSLLSNIDVWRCMESKIMLDETQNENSNQFCQIQPMAFCQHILYLCSELGSALVHANQNQDYLIDCFSLRNVMVACVVNGVHCAKVNLAHTYGVYQLGESLLSVILTDCYHRRNPDVLTAATQIVKALTLLLDHAENHEGELVKTTQSQVYHPWCDVSKQDCAQERSESNDGGDKYLSYLSPVKMFNTMFSNASSDDLKIDKTRSETLHTFGKVAGTNMVKNFSHSSMASRFSRLTAEATLNLWTCDLHFSANNSQLTSMQALSSNILMSLKPLIPHIDESDDNGDVEMNADGLFGDIYPLWVNDNISLLASNIGEDLIPQQSGENPPRFTANQETIVGVPSFSLIKFTAAVVEQCNREYSIEYNSQSCAMRYFISSLISRLDDALSQHRAAIDCRSCSGVKLSHVNIVGRLLLLQEVLLDACFVLQKAESNRMSDKKMGGFKPSLLVLIVKILLSPSLNLSDMLLYAPLSTPVVTLLTARLVSKVGRYSFTCISSCDADQNSDKTRKDFTDSVLQICLSAYSSAFIVAMKSEQKLMSVGSKISGNDMSCLDDFLDMGNDSHLLASCPSDTQRLLYSLYLMNVWGVVFAVLVRRIPDFESPDYSNVEVNWLHHVQRALLDLFVSSGGLFLQSSLLRNMGSMAKLKSMQERKSHVRRVNEVTPLGLTFLLEAILHCTNCISSFNGRQNHCTLRKTENDCLCHNGIQLLRDFWSIQALFDLSSSTLWWQKLEDKFSVGLTQEALGGDKIIGEGDVAKHQFGQSSHSLYGLQKFTEMLPILSVELAKLTPPLVACEDIEKGSKSFLLQHLSVGRLVRTLCPAINRFGTDMNIKSNCLQGILKAKWVDAYTNRDIYKHVKGNCHLIIPQHERVVPLRREREENDFKFKKGVSIVADGTSLGIMLFLSAIIYVESHRVCHLQDGFTGMLMYFRSYEVSNSPFIVTILMTVSREILYPLFQQRMLQMNPPILFSISFPSVKFPVITHIPSTAISIALTQCLHSNHDVRMAAYFFIRHTISSGASPSLIWESSTVGTILQCLEALDSLGSRKSLDITNVAAAVDENFFSIDITPINRHFCSCGAKYIPPMEFPRQDIATLLAVAKPFLLLAYEWLTMIMHLLPWLATEILEEYLLHLEERNQEGGNLTSSIVHEILGSKGPTFHMTDMSQSNKDANVSPVKVARLLAAKAVAEELSCHSSSFSIGRHRGQYSSCCSEPPILVKFAYVPKSNPADSLYTVHQFGSLTKARNPLSTLATKATCCGQVSATSHDKCYKRFLHFRNSFEEILHTHDPEKECTCMNVVHNIHQGASILRKLYLLRCYCDDVGTCLDDEKLLDCTMALMSLFEEVFVKGFCRQEVVTALIFSWRWLLAVPNFKGTPALYLKNGINVRYNGKFPLANIVIQNVLSCFKLSSEVNAGMFSCHDLNVQARNERREASTDFICPRRASRIDLLATSKPSNVNKVVKNACSAKGPDASWMHIEWMNFLFEIFASYCHEHTSGSSLHSSTAFSVPDQSPEHAVPDVEKLLLQCLGSVLGHPSLTSPWGTQFIPRFCLLSLCTNILIHSTRLSTALSMSMHHDSPNQVLSSILIERRILREKIYIVALLSFADVDMANSTPVNELEKYESDDEVVVLQLFLNALKADLHTVPFEYGMWIGLSSNENHIANDMKCLSPSSDHCVRDILRTMCCEILSVNGATDFSSSHSMHHRAALNYYFSPSNRIVQCPADGVLRVGSLLSALLLRQLDLHNAWSCGFASNINNVSYQSTSKTVSLALSCENLSDIVKLPDSWFQDMIQTAWQISPVLAVSFCEQFRFRISAPPKIAKLGKNFCECCCKLPPHNGSDPLSVILSLILHSPQSVHSIPRAAELVLLHIATCVVDEIDLHNFIGELYHWATLPVPAIINVWMRLPALYSSMSPNQGHIKKSTTLAEMKKRPMNGKEYTSSKSKQRAKVESNSKQSDLFFNGIHKNKIAAQYLMRSLRGYLTHPAGMQIIEFYLPQIVQLLRRDPFGILADFVADAAKSNDILCHRIVWQLQVEGVSLEDNSGRYGYCFELLGRDCLPTQADKLLNRIKSLLSPSQLAYLHDECDYFNAVTNISATLNDVPNKALHNSTIKQKLMDIRLPPGLYMPTNPYHEVLSAQIDSGVPMQSAAKCPFLLVFETKYKGKSDNSTNSFSQDEKDEDRVSFQYPQGDNHADIHGGTSTPPSAASKPGEFYDNDLRHSMQSSEGEEVKIVTRLKSREMFASDQNFKSPKIYKDELRGDNTKVVHSSEMRFGSATGVSQNLSDDNAPCCRDTFTELKEDGEEIDVEFTKKDVSDSESEGSLGVDFVENVCTLLRDSWKKYPGIGGESGNQSPYPTHTYKKYTEACIFKVYDDCRQDAITVQVIRLLRDVTECLGVPVYLVPYNIIPCRTGCDNAPGGMLQVINDVKSRDRIGKDGFKSLLQLFESRFGRRGSTAFRSAQLEFCRSLAGYAVVCFLLQIKDRHNGNILLDNSGHIIHIDFGFLLGISPGGNLGFENAAFKFSREMIELLDVECDDATICSLQYDRKVGLSNTRKNCKSTAYQYFEDLTVRTYLAARAAMDPILIVVGSMVDAGLPCFQYRHSAIQDLRSRFMPNLCDSQARTVMIRLIEEARNKWTTVMYDGIQKLQNNIYSDTWR